MLNSLNHIQQMAPKCAIAKVSLNAKPTVAATEHQMEDVNDLSQEAQLEFLFKKWKTLYFLLLIHCRF